MNYRSLLITAVMLGLPCQQAQSMQYADMNTAKTAGWLVAAAMVGGGIPYVMKKLKDNQTINKMCDNLAVNLNDAGNVVGIAGGSYVFSKAVNPEMGQTFQRFSVRAIPAATVVALTSNRTSANLFHRIPLIGQFIVCPDATVLNPDGTSKCPGICSKCKLTKGITGIVGYVAFSGAINCFNGKYGTNF